MSLHVVPDPEPPSLGDAIAYWADNATQWEVERADEHVTRHEDDDYGDVDGGERQQHVADLRGALRARWDR